MKKNWLGIIKGAVLLGLVAACVMVSAKDVKAFVVGSGTQADPWECGDSGANVKAYIDGTTLKISGTGNMADYGNVGSTPPWHSDYRDIIEEVEFSGGITHIGNYSFSACKKLKGIDIPNSVTSIGSQAFETCLSVKELTIPNNVVSIGMNAFSGCSGLQSVILSNNLSSIAAHTFYGCSALTSITIPEGVNTINKGAFELCDSLKNITIPSTVNDIGVEAFKFCSGLTSIEIKGDTVAIGTNAFQSCTPTAVIFSGNVSADTINKAINSSGMMSTNLKSIVVPDNKIDTLRTTISDNASISDDNKSTILSNIKTETAYEAENSAKSSPVNDSHTDDIKEEKETASQGTPTGPSKSVYEEKMDSLIKDINALIFSTVSTSSDKNAADGEKSTDNKKTLYLKDVTSLSLSVMKELQKNPNVNLDMTYTYKGIAFHVVIPAGTAVFDESIPWYGPLWLYAHYGQGTLTKVGGNSSNVCLVQSGDTLRKIAAKYGMTLDELIKKNPQIKNIDKISIGDKINL